ncbi:hypothetical protein RGQ29_028525 [Quercus rubra]|uniref:phospholipase D n=1 Tax=Quercus rubra TaxID=3512 RepID=A0AAN7ES38_QUERU|nr:hypothetical protein RGQ29_028525 [Quercus rubra]
MDNYGSSSSYPHHNPYAYPPPPTSAYPPPPPNPDPYHTPAYPYQHNSSQPYPYAYPPSPSSTSHSGPLDYHQPPPPSPSPTSYSGPLDYHHPPPPSPSRTSYSGPLDYHHPPPIYPYPYPVASAPHCAPQPSLEHHSSFQYGPSHYPYQQSGPYPPPESQPQVPFRANSFSDYHRQDSSSSIGTGSSSDVYSVNDSTPSRPSAYPPLDDLISNMQLSDNHSTAPASHQAPTVSPLASAPPSARYDKPGEFYSHSNSFSSSYGASYSAQSDLSNHSVYGHTSSFNGSQHSQSLQIVPLQNKGSLKVLLLHGNLDIWVYHAHNLPNMDMFHKTLGDMFTRLPGNVSNKIEGHMSRKITSDPYVSISVSNAVIGRTFVISNSENPDWKQHFYVPVAHQAAEVHFVVKDSDVVGSQLIGVVAIPVEQIYSGAKVEGTYPILNNNGKPCKPGAALKLSIQYTPIEKLSIYHRGVGAGPDYHGVPGTYFPLRKGGTVTLYQDAHVPDGSLPNVKLDQGMDYVHGKCWRDIFDAIRQASRLVYITGWSVWHKVRLVRDAGNASNYTLGDLLKTKSQEGVRVLLLIWDDPTSRNILGYQTDGIMQTHDEETRRFFKHSSVQVLLCPRIAGKRHSWVKQKEVETIYTHHQKTVIVDADAGNFRRKIIAFVGGLDLCDGRYDTPQHPIFRTLQTVHKDDYHNPTYAGNTAGCPREPWHDLHTRIDGPAAYDVLTNFEERWLKAAKPQGIKKLKMSYDDALLRLERIPEIIGLSDAPWTNDNDPEAWHVQIFRSIDSNSVRGFPKDPRDATNKNLVCGKNLLIDMSIHTAYVKAIRAAQHFIYIENQYFIGSSYNWSLHKDIGANNLIPMEIALKIAEKIRANERFAVYIVIPMWPEGAPTGAATQRILYWQI